jgi:hypothetical protein
MLAHRRDVAIPLRVLARYWVAYYWPFVDAAAPVYQGQRRSTTGAGLAEDMQFRPALASLRLEWEAVVGQAARPSDGFVVIADMTVERGRASYPQSFIAAYERALDRIEQALEQPIKFAGEGNWGTFGQPRPFERLDGVVGVPGTRAGNACVVVPVGLWDTFANLSLWIEALSLHEWCLFSERIVQPVGHAIDRGDVYRLLTDRPDNRRPLTWERNRVDILLLEGRTFVCPLTGRVIDQSLRYDLDHLAPLAVYPINDLWNLVPADRWFNQHRKCDRLPSDAVLVTATPRLELTYAHYRAEADLARALTRDVRGRFSTLAEGEAEQPAVVAHAVGRYLRQLAETRNIARFEA